MLNLILMNRENGMWAMLERKAIAFIKAGCDLITVEHELFCHGNRDYMYISRKKLEWLYREYSPNVKR